MEAVPNGAPDSAEAVGPHPTPAAGAKRKQSAGRTAARLLAREGKRVVRPKGDDPFIFGRGGEAATLAEAGIACGVVPGITACAAQAAMPLTHRDAARMLTPVTGHTRDGRPDLDFATLGRPGQGSTLAAVIGNGGTAPRHPWRGTDPAPSCAGPPATVTTHDQPAQDARRAIQDHPPA